MCMVTSQSRLGFVALVGCALLFVRFVGHRPHHLFWFLVRACFQDRVVMLGFTKASCNRKTRATTDTMTSALATRDSLLPHNE